MNTLFVYGSLRPCFSHPLSALLKASSHYLGEGYFQGELFELSGYPGAVDSSLSTKHVVGDVYTACNNDLLLELDDYEHWFDPDHQKREFLRVIRSIKMSGHEKLNAWIYLYNLPTKGYKPISHGDYCKYLASGQ